MAGHGTQVRVIIPYSPRPLQRVLHNALESHRWSVAVCHRRFGKTVLAVNHLIKCALLCDKPRPRFAYLAPFRNQAKDLAWKYLKFYAGTIPGVSFSEIDLSVTLPNEATIRIYGADNEDALRGIYLDGVVLDEYGDMSDTVFSQVLRPALSDRRGWAFFMGTPKGRNQFYEMVKVAQRNPTEWFYACYKASETGVIAEDELLSARQTMTEDQYQQEYECSFEAAIKGAVYAREMAQARESGRIGRISFDPRVPVDTSWDLGIDDAMSIWLSQSIPGGEVRLIGYYENSGHGLPHYVGVLREQAAKYGYTYGEHYLPHDVEVKELGTGMSRLETLRTLGLTTAMVVPRMSLDDGINATRMLLPRCWFNETSCEDGIEALRHYRWKEASDNQTGRTLPVHDWASHGADSLRTLACAPARSDKLLAQWNAKNYDSDPADARWGKGKYRSGRTQARGGW